MDEELLTRIDETIRAFPEVKDRFAPKRLFLLQKFQCNVVAHLSLTVDMLTTLNEMKKALDKEIAFYREESVIHGDRSAGTQMSTEYDTL